MKNINKANIVAVAALVVAVIAIGARNVRW